MKKLLVILALLLALPLWAQGVGDASVDKAERVLNYVLKGQGDSLQTVCDDAVRQALPASAMDALIGQIQSQMGKYVSHGAWQVQEQMGRRLYVCNITFERGKLGFLTSFDADCRANTLRIVPPVSEMESGNASAATLPEGVTEQSLNLENAGFTMPAVLTMPRDGHNVPIAVLVHGSGPGDRDETVGADKPFRDLAWGLALQGIATFRFDKRTNVYGANYKTAGKDDNLTDEVLSDAVAAVALAGSRPGVDSRRVWVIGHSLGAMLAPIVARQSPAVAGLVMIAAPARPLEDLIVEQVTYLERKKGTLEQNRAMIDRLKRQTENVKRIGTLAYEDSVGTPLIPSLGYWRELGACKQRQVAAGLKLPMLIIQGEADYQVTLADFALWKKSLAGKPNVKFKSYQGLDHLMMPQSEQPGMAQRHIPAEVIGDIAAMIKGK